MCFSRSRSCSPSISFSLSLSFSDSLCVFYLKPVKSIDPWKRKTENCGKKSKSNYKAKEAVTNRVIKQSSDARRVGLLVKFSVFYSKRELFWQQQKLHDQVSSGAKRTGFYNQVCLLGSPVARVEILTVNSKVSTWGNLCRVIEINRKPKR